MVNSDTVIGSFLNRDIRAVTDTGTVPDWGSSDCLGARVYVEWQKEEIG